MCFILWKLVKELWSGTLYYTDVQTMSLQSDVILPVVLMSQFLLIRLAVLIVLAILVYIHYIVS